MLNESVKQQTTSNLLESCTPEEIRNYLELSFTTLICSQHWTELDEESKDNFACQYMELTRFVNELNLVA